MNTRGGRDAVWLTEKQVERLTRRKRPSAQASVLREAGIHYDWVDGRPVVMKDSLTHREKPKGRLILA
jgi:Domain of unknown function (DUF4224)